MEKYYIVPNYSGDIRDAMSSLTPSKIEGASIVENKPPRIRKRTYEKKNKSSKSKSKKIRKKSSLKLMSHSAEKQEGKTKCCGKYFCFYCLKGSYQVNVENSILKPNEISISQASTCNNSEQEKLKIKDEKNQLPMKNNFKAKKLIKQNTKTLTKDWCCPWCTGECFCSRCQREEQIFKLLSVFFFYEGNLFNLFIEIISENPLLKALKNHLIISNLEIKDLLFLERQCKSSKKIDEQQQNDLGLLLLLKQITIKLAEQKTKLEKLEKVKTYFSYLNQSLQENKNLQDACSDFKYDLKGIQKNLVTTNC